MPNPFHDSTEAIASRVLITPRIVLARLFCALTAMSACAHEEPPPESTYARCDNNNLRTDNFREIELLSRRYVEVAHSANNTSTVPIEALDGETLEEFKARGNAYLPNVVFCEMQRAQDHRELLPWFEANRGRFKEALKAQAIAARSALYYFSAQNHWANGRPWVWDGEGQQVYSTRALPRGCQTPGSIGPEYFEAVYETSGQIMVDPNPVGGLYNIVGGFYAGDARAATEPVYRPEQISANPSLENTCNFPRGFMRTFSHDNASGTAIEAASLSRVASNHGRMLQQFAACLAAADHNHREILEYFYGDEDHTIIVDAREHCGGPPVAVVPADSDEGSWIDPSCDGPECGCDWHGAPIYSSYSIPDELPPGLPDRAAFGDKVCAEGGGVRQCAYWGDWIWYEYRDQCQFGCRGFGSEAWCCKTAEDCSPPW